MLRSICLLERKCPNWTCSQLLKLFEGTRGMSTIWGKPSRERTCNDSSSNKRNEVHALDFLCRHNCRIPVLEYILDLLFELHIRGGLLWGKNYVFESCCLDNTSQFQLSWPFNFVLAMARFLCFCSDDRDSRFASLTVLVQELQQTVILCLEQGSRLARPQAKVKVHPKSSTRDNWLRLQCG